MPLDLWIENRMVASKQFKFWWMVLSLELAVFRLIRAFREHNIQSYISSLISLAPWFSALNHTHYRRWLPVHTNDMLQLPERHPKVYAEFEKGLYIGQKTTKLFSYIALHQVHEQENIKIKGIAGAVSIIG